MEVHYTYPEVMDHVVTCVLAGCHAVMNEI